MDLSVYLISIMPDIPLVTILDIPVVKHELDTQAGYFVEVPGYLIKYPDGQLRFVYA